MKGPDKINPADTFYDAVAKDYNSHMTDNDRKAREIIHSEFGKLVKKGNVLDFGGGTGLDLPWLTSNSNYRVFFLEPSVEMREVARKTMFQAHNASSLLIANDHLDFNIWQPGSLPFPEKMDGVLANFAVLNSIGNLETLFDKIALICNKDCHLFFTVINGDLAAVIKKYPLTSVARYLFHKKLAITNNHQGVNHVTHIHSLRSLQSASAKHFNFIGYKPVRFSNFSLLILSKK